MTTGILIIGHGSKEPAPHETMCQLIKQMQNASSDTIIKYCYLTNAHPTIQEGLQNMTREPIDILICVPMFFSTGTHVTETIPRILNTHNGNSIIRRKDNTTIPLIYAKPIGADPLLAQILLNRAKDANPYPETI